MRFNYLLVLISCCMAFCCITIVSCVNDVIFQNENEGDAIKLSIETSFHEVETRAQVVDRFNQGDILGLFVTKANSLEVYNPWNKEGINGYGSGGFVDGQWETDILLADEKATIYAFFPGELSNRSHVIQSNISDQFDILYGTHVVGSPTFVNKAQNKARLDMKHAMGIVEFFFRKKDYHEIGKVTEIKISNAASLNENDHCIPYIIGVNFITGEISSIKQEKVIIHAVNRNKGLVPELPSNFPETGVSYFLRTLHPVKNDGDIQFNFVIDEKSYTWNVPAGTDWEGGYRYSYYITISPDAPLSFEEVIIRTPEDKDETSINL